MNKVKLAKHLKDYYKRTETDSFNGTERAELQTRYAKFDKGFMATMTADDLFEYISPLWAMQIWGNKQYYVNKLIKDNGLDKLKENLSNLVWGNEDISNRWDNFRANIKGLGPAMASELLIRAQPKKYILWNKKALVALAYLEVKNLPYYNYQITGAKYKELCNVGLEISSEMVKIGFKDTSLLAVDYFFWDSLQIEDAVEVKIEKDEKNTIKEDFSKQSEAEFVHNDIRDKVEEIGRWLGLSSSTETRVATGAVVDVVWESNVANMGRIIYVFEVQTKGSIDSLILNLMKAKSNPAVQGIVAISDKKQLEKIKKEAEGINLTNLKFWDYEDVLKVHASLEKVYESINTLKLVPEGF